MIEISERFPDTPEGIRAAQKAAGEDGDWAGYVDWWTGDTSVSRTRQIAKSIMRSGGDVHPSTLANVGIVIEQVPVVSTPDISTMEIAHTVIPYSGTEGIYDIPATVVVPQGDRANLPA